MELPSKITIPVDYGYAFDFLSIYEVKLNKVDGAPLYQNIKNFTEANHHIKDQIGEQKFFEIIESQEYLDLVKANQELFELVDLAKTDAVKASIVDDGVYKRFLCKRKLQEKFFPDAEKVEQKIGYNDIKSN